MHGVPNPQSRCRFSVGIGHASSKEPDDRLAGINGLLIVFLIHPQVLLAEHLIEALGENLVCILRTRWRLWAGNCVGYLVDRAQQLRKVVWMETDAEFILDQLHNFAGGPWLALFEEALEMAELLMGELRGRQAPEAWNEPCRTILAPAVEPESSGGVACSDAYGSRCDRITRTEVAHETETTEDFTSSVFLIAAFNSSSERWRSATNRHVPMFHHTLAEIKNFL